MNQSDLAWAVGIFEGEGWISANKNRTGQVYFTLGLGMTDKDVVDRFSEIVGVGKRTDRQPKYPGSKHMWSWAAYGPDARYVFRLFEPRLSIRRLEQAKSVFSICTDPIYSKKGCEIAAELDFWTV